MDLLSYCPMAKLNPYLLKLRKLFWLRRIKPSASSGILEVFL